VFRKSKAELYERLLNEKDTHIRILVAEIDWLRAQLGRPSLPAAINPSGLPDKQAAVLDDAGWVSEAEEARAIIEKEGLSAVHLPEILDGLGYTTSDLG
jgi:hypothetical protein